MARVSYLSLLILLLGFVSEVLPQPRLGVLEFHEEGNVEKGLGREIAVLVCSAIDREKYQLKERLQLTPLVKEKLLANRPGDVGKSFQVDLLLLGEIKKSTQYSVHYRVVDLAGNIKQAQEAISARDLWHLKRKLLQSLCDKELGVVPQGYVQLVVEISYGDSVAVDKSLTQVEIHSADAGKNWFWQPGEFVPTGRYRVTVAHPHYQTYSKWIVAEESVVSIPVPLQPTKVFSSQNTLLAVAIFVGVVLLAWISRSLLRWASPQAKFARARRKLHTMTMKLQQWKETCSEEALLQLLYASKKELDNLLARFEVLPQEQVATLVRRRAFATMIKKIEAVERHANPQQGIISLLQGSVRELSGQLNSLAY